MMNRHNKLFKMEDYSDDQLEEILKSEDQSELAKAIAKDVLAMRGKLSENIIRTIVKNIKILMG